MVCSPPGSSVHGILQARILEWVAVLFRGSSKSGDLPNPGIKPASLLSFELAGGLFTTSANWEAKEGLVNVKSLSRARLFATPGTVAYQAPLPMGFSRQEYWNGLPFPSPGDLPDPGIEPRSPTL